MCPSSFGIVCQIATLSYDSQEGSKQQQPIFLEYSKIMLYKELIIRTKKSFNCNRWFSYFDSDIMLLAC